MQRQRYASQVIIIEEETVHGGFGLELALNTICLKILLREPYITGRAAAIIASSEAVIDDSECIGRSHLAVALCAKKCEMKHSKNQIAQLLIDLE